MAIYHCSVKPVQRSKGRSSVAAAAYRSRSQIFDERTGIGYSYKAKSRDLVHDEIVGFSGDRASLWNSAEASENRKDATTAREFEVALPAELSQEENIELTRQFSEWLNETQGCAVDFCIHSGAGENPHAHILTTTRSVDSEGTFSNEKIAREWSDKKRKQNGLPGRQSELMAVRKHWEQLVNARLEPEQKIDHRSHKERGLHEIPQIHVGPRANAMHDDQKIQSGRVQQNEAIKAANVEINHLLTEMKGVQQEKEQAHIQNIQVQTKNIVEKEPLDKATGMKRKDASRLSEWWNRVKARLEKATAKFNEKWKEIARDTAQDHAQNIATGKLYDPEQIEKAGIIQLESDTQEKDKSSLLDAAKAMRDAQPGKTPGVPGTDSSQSRVPTWKRWGNNKNDFDPK